MTKLFLCVLGLVAPSALAWAPAVKKSNHQLTQLQAATTVGGLHGENSCFLPLKQLDQDYYAPRIVQVRIQIFVCQKPFLSGIMMRSVLFYSPSSIFVFLYERSLDHILELRERTILPLLRRRLPSRGNGRMILAIPTDRSWELSRLRAATLSPVPRIPLF